MCIKEKVLLLILFTITSTALKAQVLETEESKPLLSGQCEVALSVEYQTSSEGKEVALPEAIEYGISKKLTILVEPVFFTGIYPNSGDKATGVGDLEVTLFYQLVTEKKNIPAISISGEIKIPTAESLLIGTDKTDYTPFLIMSKTTGKFFTSINLSYTFLGKPPGISASNLFNYAIGTTFKVNATNIIYGEFYGNTSAFGEGETPENTTPTDPQINTSELSGGENVVSVGYGYYVNKSLLISFGISYDNNNAWLFRPGINWQFGGNKE